MRFSIFHFALSVPSPFRFFWAFLLALSLRVTAAWLTHGEPVADVQTFSSWAEIVDAGANPYAGDHNKANYPPLWVFLCWLCLKLSGCTGLSFDLFLKLLVSLLDASTVSAVGLTAIAYGASEEQAEKAAFFYAVNPVAILISACHAQNDPIAIGLVLWGSWLVLEPRLAWSREFGLLLVGISLIIKPIGLLFVPFLLGHVGSLRRASICAALTVLPSLLLWLPFFFRSPREIVAALTSYGGVPDFGFIGIYNSWQNLGLGSSGINEALKFPVWYRPTCFSLLALVGWRFRKSALLEQFLVIILAFYLIYGNLAAQYLFWIVPFAAAYRSPQLLRASLLGGVVLVAFYQLHHPGILSGRQSRWLDTGIRPSQWSGVFLLTHVLLYVHWFRWLAELDRQCRTTQGE